MNIFKVYAASERIAVEKVIMCSIKNKTFGISNWGKELENVTFCYSAKVTAIA